MRLSRLLILLTGCFLLVSAAWADDLAFVDCTSHPDPTQVYSKARQTQDSVGSIPCGERFTVLLYGFIFSRVQTRDGKVGYVLSSLITADHSTAGAPQAAKAQPAPSPASAAASAPVYAASAQATAPPAPQPLASVPSNSPAVIAAPQPAPAPVMPAAPTSAPLSVPNVQATSATPSQSPAAADPQPPAAQPAATPSLPTAAQVEAATSAPATQPVSSVSDAAPTSAPEPAPAQPIATPAYQPDPQPQPAAAQPEAAPIRSASVRSSWEKPLPAGRQNFLLDVYSGYSYTRFTASSAGYSASYNLNGAMGSVGWNFKPWLQIVGDSSYNFITISGTKNKLYGNHFGARYFYRRHLPWNITPFAEGLVGGSRLDTTYSGATSSNNCISFKAGGGLDIQVSRRWEIRAIDVDYYRTSFPVNGTSSKQNNYWASAGVVLRLFGSPAE